MQLQIKLYDVGFEVLTAVGTKMSVFWVIMMMMETARFSETLVNFYQTTLRYNPEDSNNQPTNSAKHFQNRLFVWFIVYLIQYKKNHS
jgi:hypothetical protein